MEEIWKDIEGYNGLYQVSNLGRFRKNGKLLTIGKRKDGYCRVYINRKAILLHRLVVQAFVYNPNKEKYNIINHKDENPSNNVCTNLEWCDKSYNARYGSCPEKIRKFRLGKKLPDEIKDKISKASKEWWNTHEQTEEAINKMRYIANNRKRDNKGRFININK